MKSEKAEVYIDSHAKRAEERIREASTEIGKIVLSVRQVIRAVEIAEQEAFASLIDKVSGRGTWERNPWVVVYEFELLK